MLIYFRGLSVCCIDVPAAQHCSIHPATLGRKEVIKYSLESSACTSFQLPHITMYKEGRCQHIIQSPYNLELRGYLWGGGIETRPIGGRDSVVSEM